MLDSPSLLFVIFFTLLAHSAFLYLSTSRKAFNVKLFIGRPIVCEDATISMSERLDSAIEIGYVRYES